MTDRLHPFRKRLLLPITAVFAAVMTLGSVVSLLEGSMSANRYIPLIAVAGSWVSLYFTVFVKQGVKTGFVLLATSVSAVMFVFPFLNSDPVATLMGFMAFNLSLTMVLIVLSGLFGVPMLNLVIAGLFYIQFFALAPAPDQGIFNANYMFTIISVAVLSFLAIRYHTLVGGMVAELTSAIKENQQLSELSVTDPLTGLYNRRHLELILASECERVRRYSGSLSCLMIDVDHFKRFNDTFGHQKGDEVLQKVAAAMQSASRKSDMCGRYGGEEFIILTPVDLSHAEQFGERLRNIVDDLRFDFSGEIASVTVSIGISEYGDACDNENELVRMADDALYQAKVTGRDRTVLYKQ